ncbi:MAG: CHC2 zinc finger domain-containing protein [Burkholderiales bacterium]
MSADALLSRLDKVRATGRGTWVACCPAHQDKHPSMTVREADDGVVLLHCFAGCGVEQILGAVGLDFDALFPPKPIEHAKPLRRPFPAADVLEVIASEARIVATASANIRQGIQLTDADHERLMVAAERIFEARTLANGDER